MTGFLKALALSVVFHAALAIIVVLWLDVVPDCETSVTLDLSRLEMSFAEEERDDTLENVVDAVEMASATQPEPLSSAPEIEASHGAFAIPPPAMEVDDSLEAEDHVEKMITPSAPVVSVSAPRRAKIDAEARPMSEIRIEYPRSSRMRGEQGEVTVEAMVNADGSVGAALVVESCGFSALENSALKTIRKTKFNPAISNGRPVAQTVRVKLCFRLK